MRISYRTIRKWVFGIPMVLIILAVLLPVVTTAQKAQIFETTQTIKTYPFGDPNPVPVLDKKTEIYPYFRFDGYSKKGQPQGWKVVTLENEHIKLSVLPEVGGKVFGAVEKSTGNEFIYKNDVLKFRDIALRGPWTSGGIEFNFGYIGHTPATATPVDYVKRKNKDGSVSVFIGGLDLSARTQWRVEMRLPKDAAMFKTKSFWYNPTVLNQSYYYWSNAAIPAGEDLQLHFPGTNYIGHDGEAHSWPVDDKGRNVSFYKENDFGSSKAYHVLGKYQDYSGAYFNDKDFGYGHWSRHNEMPGQKIFMWALSRSGGIWEDLLTDKAGQYVEVQTGRLFNQAVLSSGFDSPFGQHLFQPQAADDWTEYWFPVKGTGGISEVSTYGTLNINREQQQLDISFNAIQDITDELILYADGKKIATHQLDLKPMEVFKTKAVLPSGTTEFTITLGNKIRYSYPSEDTIDRPITSSKKNINSNTTEDLYQKAEELMAIRKYTEALKNYKEVLESAPNHHKALTRVAELNVRKGQPERGLPYVERVLAQDTYDADANFVYGVIKQKMGEHTDAKDAFGWAARSMKYRSSGFSQMAEIYLAEKNFEDAIYYAQEALDFNTDNIAARKTMAVAQRLVGNEKEAGRVIESILEKDPLNHFARFERYLLNPSKENKEQFISMIRNEMPHETYLELGIHYVGINRIEEAKKVLQTAPDTPIVKYWQAYLNRNDAAKSEQYLQNAIGQSPQLVFPFRVETMNVLEWALEKKQSWKTNYYLGLILWDKGRDAEAVDSFAKCENKPDYPPFYLTRSKLIKNKKPAQAELDLEHALQLDSERWRSYRALTDWYLGQGEIEKALNISRKAYSKFKDNYYIGMQHASVLNENRQFEQAITVLNDVQVLPYEGATKGHQLFENAHLMLALKYIKSNEFGEALDHIDKSRQWPENLGVGQPYTPDDRFQDYLEAMIHSQQENPQKVNELFKKILEYSKQNWNNIKAGEFTKDNYVSYIILKNKGLNQKANYLLNQFEQRLSNEIFKVLELNKESDGGKIDQLLKDEKLKWLRLLRKAKSDIY